jgi:hypothetical protein
MYESLKLVTITKTLHQNIISFDCFGILPNFHLSPFLGAKSTSILDCVGPSVGRSVPHDARLRGKIIVTSRLIREEEEEEETDYVAIPLRRVLRT